MIRIRFACCVGIERVVPALKNRSKPLCLKLLITRANVTYNVTGVNPNSTWSLTA